MRETTHGGDSLCLLGMVVAALWLHHELVNLHVRQTSALMTSYIYISLSLSTMFSFLSKSRMAEKPAKAIQGLH